MKEWFRLTRPQLYLQVLHWTKVKQKRESTHKCKTKKTNKTQTSAKQPASLTRLHPEPCCNGKKHKLVNKVRGREGGNSWRDSSSLTLTPWAVCSQITGCIVSMLKGWTSFFSLWRYECSAWFVNRKQGSSLQLFFFHFLKWIPALC